MFEINEVINFVVSSALLLYLFNLLIDQAKPLNTWLNWALGFVLCSQLFTILEGVVFFEFFNLQEHLFFLAACVMFLVSVLKKEI